MSCICSAVRSGVACTVFFVLQLDLVLVVLCSAVSSGVGCPIFVQQLDQEVMYCGLSALAQGHWRHDVDPSVDEECLEREFFIPVPTI